MPAQENRSSGKSMCWVLNPGPLVFVGPIENGRQFFLRIPHRQWSEPSGRLRLVTDQLEVVGHNRRSHFPGYAMIEPEFLRHAAECESQAASPVQGAESLDLHLLVAGQIGR